MNRLLKTYGFDTAIGTCILTYSSKGISKVDLPPSSHTSNVYDPSTLQDPPQEILAVAEAIMNHANGKPFCYDFARLDLETLTPFQRTVYDVLCTIPAGTTKTYAELAAMIGRPKAARAVGSAMARNPVPLLIPCHRILAKNGLGGYSGGSGLPLKAKLLQLEMGKRFYTRRSHNLSI